MCVECRLPLSVLCVFLLFLSLVTNQVDSLLVYDRQELLNIRSSARNFVRFGVGGQNIYLLPLLSDIPAFLCRAPAPPLWRKCCRRRGKRSGLLLRLKAHLALSSGTTNRFLHGLLAGCRALHRCLICRRSLEPVGRWLVPVDGADVEDQLPCRCSPRIACYNECPGQLIFLRASPA